MQALLAKRKKTHEKHDERRQQAEQYPTMANAIRKNCPVLSGKQETCDGCKYQGKKAYDCAQVTRLSAKAAELTLPSGASSQWNKGDWAQKGAIDTLSAESHNSGVLDASLTVDKSGVKYTRFQ